MNEYPSHTISLLVANKSGTLVRIATLFSRRGFNIESLVVSPALDGRFSRMTITACGKEATLEQIIKQLSKLVDVIHAGEHDPDASVVRELALIKITATERNRSHILQLVQHFKARTVDFTDDTIIIELTGNSEKIDAAVEMLGQFGVLESIRTGKVIISRGPHQT